MSEPQGLVVVEVLRDGHWWIYDHIPLESRGGLPPAGDPNVRMRRFVPESLVTARDQRIAALMQIAEESISFYHRGFVHLSEPPFTFEACKRERCVDIRERLAAAGPPARDAKADPYLPPAESYPVTIEITEVRQGEPFSAPKPQRCEDCGGSGHLECDAMPMDDGPRYGFETPPARPGEQEADPDASNHR